MGLTTSAIAVSSSSSEEEEEEKYNAIPLDELTPVLIDYFINCDIITVLQKWAFTRDFYQFLATNSSLWNSGALLKKEVVRTENIVKLPYWNKIATVNEVIIFCGDEPFLSIKERLPHHQVLHIPFLTLVTSNDNAIEFFKTTYHLRAIVLRLEFILDDLSYSELPYLCDNNNDYFLVKEDLLARFKKNLPKELEIVLIDWRSNHSGERIVFDKIIHSQQLIRNPFASFFPDEPYI